MSKWALVTGAANGIGFELANLLSLDQYNLVLVDLNCLHEKKERLQQKYHNKILTVEIDLSEKDAAVQVFDRIKEEGVELDVLINNAGFGMFGFFSLTSWEREEKMIHLHIHTPTQLVKLFLPGMIRRKTGRILNVSSLAAFHPGPLMCIYYSTKAYLLSFSASVATELRDTGVTMTALCPGVTKTGFQKSVGAGKPRLSKNMADAAQVAAYGYRAMMKGKLLAVPGLLNNFILLVKRFLPLEVVANSVRYIQERNRQKMSI